MLGFNLIVFQACKVWSLDGYPPLAEQHISGVLLQKQPKETVIHMPAAPQPPKQKQEAKVGPTQSIWGAIWWSLATGAGMVYLAAVLCLCAWPIVHFIVKLGFHASLVRHSHIWAAASFF